MFIAKRKLLPMPLLILGLIFVTLLIDYLYNINRINSGVYFKDIHLGGKSFGEVEETLKTAHFTFLGPEGKAISIPLEKMGIYLNNKQIFETGYSLNRQKSWPRNYIHRLKIRKERVFIPFQYHVDEKLLSKSIDSLVENFTKEPENAYLKVSKNNQVKITPEKFGYHFNKDDLEQVVLDNLARLNSPLKIKTPFKKMTPEITVSSLKKKGIKDLMVSFTTRFDPKLTNRVHNIKLAAPKINNYFLAPGEVISVNRLLGDVTFEKGYKEAPIIVGGRLVPGVGGGVCQISSTLYNAALLANLEVIERHSHQLAVPYIAPGRDATLSNPAYDLAFRNTKDYYILISSRVENDELTFSFFGQPLEERVKITINVLDIFLPQVIHEQDPKLKPGEEKVIQGYPGFLVEVWKTVYRSEKKEKVEKISVDRYDPYPEIIKKGPVDN